ncbi:MAG TPA: hypothetical protein VK858_08800, partial [Longimicrobiales bacterium]|nr:hypothetical protein [Longimicrobiales bacterium]
EGSPEGLAALARQEAYFAGAAASGAPVDFLPRGGCPGPEVVELPGVRLVMVDTQWFLHDHRRGCPAWAPEAVAEAITGALDGAGDRDVVLLTHHPLRTYGPHGGHFGLRSHLFPLTHFLSWGYLPLPVLGSFYVAVRRDGITDQDLSGAENETMRALLEEAMGAADRPPLLHAAGHEHSLQVIPGEPGGPGLYLVSGAGSKSTPVDRDEGALVAASVPGYMKAEFTPAGARVSVVPAREEGNARGVGWCGVVDRESREVAACR